MRRVAAMTLVGLLLSLGLADSRPLNAAARVEIAATETPGRFTFLARGFDDNETVSTWLTGPNQQVMETKTYDTDDNGRVRFTIRMPRHFQPGRWAITIHGLSSELEAIGSFEMPLLGPDIDLAVSPASGPAGTTFTFASGQFEADEFVSYWLTGPDGTVYQGGRVRASVTGYAEFTYLIGPGTQPGPWQMSAYGWQSDHYGVAAFTVG